MKKTMKKPAKKAVKKTTKKTTKKVAKVKRRVCKSKRCMKTALPDSVFCEGCVEKNDPANLVLKTTEVEALRFAKLDAELRNDRQAVQLFDYRMADIKNKAEREIVALAHQKQQIEAAITARKPEYQQLVKSLAEKYGIDDPNKMTIDPDTCVIRDLSQV